MIDYELKFVKKQFLIKSISYDNNKPTILKSIESEFCAIQVWCLVNNLCEK